MAYTDRFPIVNNFLETRLAADCDAGATTLYLESVEALPQIITGRDYVPLVLRDASAVREIVYVEAVNKEAGAVVVRRGQEGTNSVGWKVGSYVYCTVTAGSFQRMRVNGFAPLVDGDSGRPVITKTSATTATISGDFSSQLEVGMAVRVLAGGSVVAPANVNLGAIHLTRVEYSGGKTTLAFQNVTLPNNVSGLDLGLSVATAPMYHPDTVVADNDTLMQEQNVLRVSDKFKDDIRESLKDEVLDEQAIRDAAQDAAIAGKLSTSGGTVTGSIVANAGVSFKSPSLTHPPAETSWGQSAIQFYDANNVRVGFIQPYYRSDGVIEMRIVVSSDGKTNKYFNIHSNGKLVWDGKYVATFTSDNKLQFPNGTQFWVA